MRITNNLFKVILPLLLMLTAFSVDAQLSRTVVKDNGNTGGDELAPCDYDGYSYYMIIPSVEDFPCSSIHLGVTIEETQSTYYFPINPGEPETTEIPDPDGPDSGGPVTEYYYYTFTVDGLNTEIYNELCSDSPETITFTYNLYCYDGASYTVFDTEDEEFSAYLGVEPGTDISETWEANFCCPEATSVDDPLLPFAGGGDNENDGESDDDGYGYISIDGNHLNATEGIQESFDKSILDVRNFNNSVEIKITNNLINVITPLSSYFQIVNISGQIVIQGNLLENIEKQIDISNLNHGLYILTYHNNGKVESKKFVK